MKRAPDRPRHGASAPLYDRGRPRRRRHDDPADPRPARLAATRCRASCSTASRARSSQAEALDDLLERARPAARRSSSTLQVPTDSSCSTGCSSAPSSRRPRRRHARGDPPPARELLRARDRAARRVLPSTRGNVVGIHAERAIDDVFHEIADVARAGAGRAHDHPQVRAGDRGHGARRRARPRDARSSSRSTSRPA